MLKKIRLIAAVIVGALFTYGFVSIGSSGSLWISSLAQTQVIPAILAGSVVALVALSLLALIFGRIYCSVLCPLGILQDVIGRFSNRFRKIGKHKKNVRTFFEVPYNFLRYFILTIACAGLLFNIGAVSALLDPYSNFGRIAVNLFKPVILGANNLLANLFNSFGNYAFYRVTIEVLSWGTLIFSSVVLLLLIVIVSRSGRLWCNTVCPVGTFLGILSRVSIFKITIDSSKCNHCKQCVVACKSHCISDDDNYVDHSRCVTCFNCVNRCKAKAIEYKLNLNVSRYPKKPKPTPTTETTTSRKEFITTMTTTALLLPLSLKAQNVRLNASRYPVPPGAGSVARFQRKCTACQLCVSKCPSHVLRPAIFENGINGFMLPYLDFNVHRFCEYECTTCIDVCPSDALKKITLEQKKQTQIGVVQFDIDQCIVKTKDEYCGACGEHCPTQAVHMVPYKEGLTIPQIDPSICVGCGACESICPVRPEAIYVVRNDEHKTVSLPEIKESEKIEIDEFGF